MSKPTSIEECMALPLIVDYQSPAGFQWGPLVGFFAIKVCPIRAANGDVILVARQVNCLNQKNMWGRIEEYSILVEHVPDQGGTQLSTQEGRNLGESYPQATVATETYLRLYVIIGQHILDRAQKWRKYWVALRECNYEGVQAAQCNRAYALYYASVWAAKALANVLDEEAAKLDPLVSVDSLMRDLYRCALHLHLTFDRCSPHIDQLLEWIRAQAQGS